MLLSGLLQRVAAIPQLEVTGDEAAQLRLAHAALMQDRDPAVRRTLACSLHEVAALLGPDQALQDLGAAIQVCHDLHAMSSLDLYQTFAVQKLCQVCACCTALCQCCAV